MCSKATLTLNTKLLQTGDSMMTYNMDTKRKHMLKYDLLQEKCFSEIALVVCIIKLTSLFIIKIK